MTAVGGRRRDVLAVLREADAPMSIAAIAEQLDVHANTVRFHLDALLESEQVRRVTGTQTRPGRPAQLFAAVAGMDPGGPRDYRLLAEALAESVASGSAPGSQTSAAGRAMGARLASARPVDPDRSPVGKLVDLLDELGFAPESNAAGTEIALRHCPFLELAQSRPEVICPVHLGLMQGAMEVWGGAVSVDGLRPFVQPDRCVAQLRPAPRERAGASADAR
ncbi:helix-turn-helix domain-containing protein [Mycobacterium sp. TNTM28]|uniref:Helix-turn-helix domain-containing protein n=1 Tax=[Mycobacterium] fortunisiensis TaxID=2600579 RepID=A0ABS6KS47_9MYCO|nr:helix-turn-helix domain-containing protein [[Mycobacterium] fortunisiensis]MBU9766283.1 helix-turn-helix domain-containing protein [[Mycobacterium] fortunisiensis]